MRLVISTKNILLSFVLLFEAVNGARNVLDLSHQSWTLSSPQHSIKVPGKVPSHAHVDLYNAGKIDNPYVLANYD